MSFFKNFVKEISRGGTTRITRVVFNNIDSSDDFKIVGISGSSAGEVGLTIKNLGFALTQSIGANYHYNDITKELLQSLATLGQNVSIISGTTFTVKYESSDTYFGFMIIQKKGTYVTLDGIINDVPILDQRQSLFNDVNGEVNQVNPNLYTLNDFAINMPIKDTDGHIFATQFQLTQSIKYYEVECTIHESQNPFVSLDLILNGCSANINEMEANVENTLTLTPNNNFFFPFNPFVIMNGMQSWFDINENGTATIKITPNVDDTIKVVGGCQTSLNALEWINGKTIYGSTNYRLGKIDPLSFQSLENSFFYVFSKTDLNFETFFAENGSTITPETFKNLMQNFASCDVFTDGEIYQNPIYLINGGTVSTRLVNFAIVPKGRAIKQVKSIEIENQVNDVIYHYALTLEKVFENDDFDVYQTKLTPTDGGAIRSSCYLSYTTTVSTDIDLFNAFEWNNGKNVVIEFQIGNCVPNSPVLTDDIQAITLTPLENGVFSDTATVTIDGETTPISVENNMLEIQTTNKISNIAIHAFAQIADVVAYIYPQYNLDNCLGTPEYVDNISKSTITLEANDGYRFESVPYALINGAKAFFSVSTDLKTAILVKKFSNGDIVKIFGTAIEIPQEETIVITNNATNCVLNQNSVTVGQSYILTLTPYENFHFDTPPKISINGIINDFTLLENGIATYQLTPQTQDSIVITGEAIANIVEVNSARIEYELENVVLIPMPTVFQEGTKLNFLATLKDGYEWRIIPYYESNAFTTNLLKVNFEKDGENYKVSLPTSAMKENVADKFIRFVVKAEKVTNVAEKYGILTLFKPTAENLVELSKQRFINIATGEVKDLGQYITSLKSIPLDVETTKTGDIILGNSDTDINCPIVDNDEITLELPEIAVQGKYNNALDNSNLTVELVLPYVGIVELDASKCANKSIKIVYRLSLISGECVAMVYLASAVGNVLLTQASGTIGFDVPYILKTDTANVMQNAGGDLLFKDSPCLNVYENLKASESDTMYGTKYIDTVGNLHGYNKVSRIVSIDNDGVIMNEEMQEIERLLKEGIICPNE